MQRIHWHSELELGHAEIDAQHKRMVEIFNALHAAVYENRAGEAENRLLDEMVRVSEENFRTEERLMRSRADWAERFAGHCDAHEHLLHEMVRLRDTLFERRAPVNLKTLHFLKKWLFEHMQGPDRELLEITIRAAG